MKLAPQIFRSVAASSRRGIDMDDADDPCETNASVDVKFGEVQLDTARAGAPPRSTEDDPGHGMHAPLESAAATPKAMPPQSP